MLSLRGSSRSTSRRRRNAHKALINVTLRLVADGLGVAAYGVSEVKLLHAIN